MSDDVQAGINDYWSAHAAAYDESQRTRQAKPGAREVWARVWDEALPSRPARVLDLGTGSGNVALLLAELGYDVTGIDLAPGMLERARQKSAGRAGAPRFLEADAASPPFAPGSFDALTARYVLWTLRDPQVAFRKWRALLRPGGALVAVDSLWYPRGVDAQHRCAHATDRDRDFLAAYDADALARLPLAEAGDISVAARLLEEAGFADVTIDELPGVKDLDERYGVAPGHRAQMQYRICARVTAGHARLTPPM